MENKSKNNRWNLVNLDLFGVEPSDAKWIEGNGIPLTLERSVFLGNRVGRALVRDSRLFG